MNLDLRTDRLDLFPLRSADADALHALWTTAGVRRFLWDGVLIPPDRTREIALKSQALFRERGFGIWCARLRARPEIVGFGGFWHFRDPPDLELLFGVDEARWGRGYATEIGRAAVDYGFDALGFDRIQASTDAANLASVRVLEKIGFSPLERVVTGGLDTQFFELSRRAG